MEFDGIVAATDDSVVLQMSDGIVVAAYATTLGLCYHSGLMIPCPTHYG
jgi:hypothetical protein